MLIRAFQNLSRLDVCEADWDITDSVEDRRWENKAAQQTLRWQNISHLARNLMSLYCLALQCPVTTLDLATWFSPEQARMLAAVVGDTTSTNLCFGISDNFPTHALKAILQGISEHLTRLLLSVGVASEGPSPREQFVRAMIGFCFLS